MATSPSLHHAIVQSRTRSPTRAVFLVHGILGSGNNLRGLAQRFVEQDASFAAVLVDLRGHGRSPPLSPPHSVAACADDLCSLEAALPWPVAAVFGHSFGGKVALAYHRKRPELARVALLDSAPCARLDRAGSEETLAVIDMLGRAPHDFPSRAQFIEYIHAHGHSRAIADWLAMNLARSADRFVLRTDLAQIRALLDDYFKQDMWDVIAASQARIDLVVGGHSRVWPPDELARARALAARSHGRVRVKVLPDAGHWVHADDLLGVSAALAP